jgi:DNA-binding GntR family transcriptional regulator
VPPPGNVGVSVGVAAGAGELMADRAYAEMRDRIVTLRIPPGSPIDEDALGKELAMGRTPVREAIKRLSLENLVTVFPRRGTFASEINITDLAHIADVRVQLEAHAAYRAAERIAPAQRDELEELLAELERTSESADPRTLVDLDTRVHRFIYRCADNPYLEETLGRYLNLSLRIWHLVIDRLPHLSARVHEHSDLLAAIRDGDAEKARQIAGDHVITFEQEIRSVL